MSETVVTVEPGNRNNSQAPPPPKPAAPQNGAGPLSWITFNTAYFQSVPGLLKLIQLVSFYPSENWNSTKKIKSNWVSNYLIYLIQTITISIQSILYCDRCLLNTNLICNFKLFGISVTIILWLMQSKIQNDKKMCLKLHDAWKNKKTNVYDVIRPCTNTKLLNLSTIIIRSRHF